MFRAREIKFRGRWYSRMGWLIELGCLKPIKDKSICKSRRCIQLALVKHLNHKGYNL